MKDVKIEESKYHKILKIFDRPQMIVPYDIKYRKNMSEILFVNAMDFHSNKKDLNVLNIGLGAGYTTEEILKRDYIKKLDVVEIYQEVIDLLPNFDTYDKIIHNPKLNIICEDGKEYVKNTEEKYDIIVIDLCHPDLECCKELFEYEFYSNLEKILNKNGIILIWYYSNLYRIKNYTIGKNIINDLDNIYNFVDFIEIPESVGKYSYFFASNKMYNYNQNSIIYKYKNSIRFLNKN